MNLKEEEYKAIMDMAALFFSPEEIANNLEVDPDDFILELHDKESQIFKAFNEGRITTDIQLRASILQSALNGSSPAQQMMKEYQYRSSYE